MKAWITGGGFVTAEGFGTLSDKAHPQIVSGEPQIPKGKEIFRNPLPRYGRFDKYTRLGCAGIALAVRDAGLDEAQEKRPIGIVLSTEYESYASDMDYYQSTLEENGAYASPNLFSYTLPGIVLGEMAIHFKMTGPTVITGEASDNRVGWIALDTALEMLQSGLCDTIVSGWLDSPPQVISSENALHGSVFVVLSKHQLSASAKVIDKTDKIISHNSGREILSILDLF